MYTKYTYEDEKHHLSGAEALSVYKKAREKNPGAIVILNDRDCGHWDVDVYNTPEQKEQFYRNHLKKMYSKLFARFK